MKSIIIYGLVLLSTLLSVVIITIHQKKERANNELVLLREEARLDSLKQANKPDYDARWFDGKIDGFFEILPEYHYDYKPREYYVFKEGDILWRLVEDTYNVCKPQIVSSICSIIYEINGHIVNPKNEVYYPFTPGEKIYLPKGNIWECGYKGSHGYFRMVIDWHYKNKQVRKWDVY